MFMPHLVILPIVMKQLRESTAKENEKKDKKILTKQKINSII